MAVVQAGSTNINGLVVPGLTVQIVSPQAASITGVPSNIAGMVGTATWGPVNSATNVQGPQDGALKFGPVQARSYDLMTQVCIAALQGANSFKCVRVTDGTDTAATVAMKDVGVAATGTITFSAAPTTNDTVTVNGVVITFVTTGATGNQINIGSGANGNASALQAFLAASSNSSLTVATYTVAAGVVTVTYNTAGTAGNAFTLAKSSTAIAVSGSTLSGGVAPATNLTITAKYTGSTGNSITTAFTTGSKAGSYALIVTFPGGNAEKFDNLTGTGNALYVAAANAVNNGINGLRGASGYVTAAAGASTLAPATTTYTLSGGTDGVTSITTSVLIGSDTATPRSGMYALRNNGCAVAGICDLSDTTSFAAQLAFGLSEGIYMVGCTPSGDSIANATATKASAGIDGYEFKYLFGDWLYWNDTVNGYVRLVSPIGAVVGLLANLSPQNSGLNKPIQGIVGTQKSYSNQVYAQADLVQLIQAGIDVIANPSPGGNYFSLQAGHNSSSNALTHNDAYTKLTNFIAYSLNGPALGGFVGQTNSSTTRAQAVAAMQNFFANMQSAGQIGMSSGSGPAFSVQDITTVPQAQKGYAIFQVVIAYLSIIEQFIVNVQGSTTNVIVGTNNI